MFLVCEQCGTVAEPSAAGLGETVHDLVGASGFELRTHVLEVTGRCPECSRTDDP